MNRIDPIFASVLQRRLKSITEEIGLTLLRTTRSPILNEARDFATGLYDAQGRMLEQTEYIPVLAFALQPSCEHVIRFFGDDIAPGDVILHNDPYAGATHSPDVAIVIPIFHEGELIGFSGASAHVLDIGASTPGGVPVGPTVGGRRGGIRQPWRSIRAVGRQGRGRCLGCWPEGRRR